jgi:hypothetical protein
MPRRKAADKDKPKGRTSAYAFFVRDMKEKGGQPKAFTDLSKFCADEWKQLGDDDKQQYHDLAAQDKMRYDREMAEYRLRTADSDDPKEANKKANRRKKDSNLPKRSLSAFMFFSNEKRPEFKAENPKDTIGDLAKKIGAAWKLLTPEDKIPYERMAQKDKQRYLEEMSLVKDGGGKGNSKQSKQSKPPKKQMKIAPKVVDDDDDEDDEEEEEEEEEEDESSSE